MGGSAVRDRDVFTTGDVGRICKVAPRTVTKWMRDGRLRGYRIPGSNDRRFTREAVLEFLRTSGMPSYGLEDVGLVRVLFLACPVDITGQAVTTLTREAGCLLLVAEDAFAAGRLCADSAPDLAVIDSDLGRCAAAKLAYCLKRANANARLIYLAPEDEGDGASLLSAGFDEVRKRPFSGREFVGGLVPKRKE